MTHPTPDFEVMDRQAQTAKLLRQLHEAEVPETLFFVITKYMDSISEAR